MAAQTLPQSMGVVTPTYIHHGPIYTCAYCGETADTVDHTVPQWLVRGNVALIQRYAFVLVAACMQCNMFAGRVVDNTFTQRRARVAKILRRKAAKVLRTGYFDPEDIEEMGHGLKTMVQQAAFAADAVKTRLRRLECPTLPEGIPDGLWISFRDREKPLRATVKVPHAPTHPT